MGKDVPAQVLRTYLCQLQRLSGRSEKSLDGKEDGVSVLSCVPKGQMSRLVQLSEALSCKLLLARPILPIAVHIGKEIGILFADNFAQVGPGDLLMVRRCHD